jgi:chromosome segregation ATPase
VNHLNDKLNSIEQKVRLLVSRLETCEKEKQLLFEKNKELIEQNRNLRSDLLLRDSEIGYLKEQFSTKEAEGTGARERQVQLKSEVDQYIRDIDKCIEWLQNH